jgi:hypothetical protein
MASLTVLWQEASKYSFLSFCRDLDSQPFSQSGEASGLPVCVPISLPQSVLWGQNSARKEQRLSYECRLNRTSGICLEKAGSRSPRRHAETAVR